MKRVLLLCAEKTGKDGELNVASSDAEESEKVLVNE
jgi:hypothetical protein